MKLRPLAFPFEHGAWGFLFEPIAVGLLVAPSTAGALIGLGTVGAFLTRHPLRLAIRDGVHRRVYSRTMVCALLALAYASVAAGALGWAVAVAGWRPLLPLAAVVPIAAMQFVLDLRNQGRTLFAEVAGAVAPGAAAAAILLVAGRPLAMALALWALLVARAVVSILYVRCALRGEPRTVMLSAHLAAVVLAISLVRVVGLGAVAAMLVLLARALPECGSLRARQVGLRELGYGALIVILIAAG